MKRSLWQTVLVCMAIASVTGYFAWVGFHASSKPITITYATSALENESFVEPPILEETSDEISSPTQTTQESEPNLAETTVFPLELNQATKEELMLLPQVGEVTAERIIQYRQQIGGYQSLEQLMEIKGIGQKTYESISTYLYLTGDAWDQAQNQ